MPRSLFILAFVLALSSCTGFSSLSVPTSSSLASASLPTAPITAPVQLALGLQFPGVNISGGEYNSGNLQARLFFDYVYPNNDELDYFASRGLKLIRVPFQPNRLQNIIGGDLVASEIAVIDQLVTHAQSLGLTVLLDPHTFGYLKDNSGVDRLLGVDPLMPAENLAGFWSKIAAHYINQPNVIFGIMNEPHDQTATQWRSVAELSVQAIRTTGATQKIFVQGTSWTGAESWVSSGNAAAWEDFNDSNFAFEVHEYLDADNSGTHADCSTGKGAVALKNFVDWAKLHHVQAFLGEVGWATNSNCMTEGEALFSTVSANVDVWIGYSYWAAGSWLGSYMYSLEPGGLGTSQITDQPQLSILRDHLK